MRFSVALFATLSLLVSQAMALHGLQVRQDAAKQKGGNKGNIGGGRGGDNGGRNGGNRGNNGGNNRGNNGGTGGNNGNGGGNQGGQGDDPQSSLTLDPAVIAEGFANDGQDPPVAGQVPSLTSRNNFINHCKTVDLPITNGKQIKTGSCNPAPMGVIPSTDNMPSSKFVFPRNLDNIEADTPFTIQMAIRGMETGFFTNAQASYFAAPQQLNGAGQVTGHSHVVVEKLDSIDTTEPSDPNVFAFFKGLNAKADNGILTASVDKGLPAGTYKLSSINTAGNHQPVLVPIAQHGSLDDAVYFTVGDAAKQAASQVAGANGGNKGGAQDNNGTKDNENAQDNGAKANNNANGQGNPEPNADNEQNADNADNKGNGGNNENADNKDNGGNQQNVDNGGNKGNGNNNENVDNADNKDNGDNANNNNGANAENEDNANGNANGTGTANDNDGGDAPGPGKENGDDGAGNNAANGGQDGAADGDKGNKNDEEASAGDKRESNPNFPISQKRQARRLHRRFSYESA